MSAAEQAIGAVIGAMRAQRELRLDELARRADVEPAHLAGIEAGEQSFTVATLERLATGLGLPFKTLVVTAFEDPGGAQPPVINPAFLRRLVPLPAGMTFDHLAAALNHTMSVVHKMNRNMQLEVGLPLQGLIQGNNFSGLVSNVLSNSFDQCTPYKHNHHQRYPDLVVRDAAGEIVEGLEIKTTIQIGKGGESHNGHSGWHLVACFNFRDDGDIRFIHAQFAQLVGHQYPGADWTYVGSETNAETGSRRTETYNTTLQGTTKLRDGSAYLDPNFIEFKRWRQARTSPCPDWSIFARPQATRLL